MVLLLMCVYANGPKYRVAVCYAVIVPKVNTCFELEFRCLYFFFLFSFVFLLYGALLLNDKSLTSEKTSYANFVDRNLNR